MCLGTIRELLQQDVFRVNHLLICEKEYFRAKAHSFFSVVPRPKGRG